MNIMTISGYQEVFTFDPDIQMFRGEFVGLNGGVDSYAADVEGLKHEGEIALWVDPVTHEALLPPLPHTGRA